MKSLLSLARCYPPPPYTHTQWYSYSSVTSTGLCREFLKTAVSNCRDNNNEKQNKTKYDEIPTFTYLQLPPPPQHHHCHHKCTP